MKDKLNEHAATGIRHPAQWNAWYLYIQARKEDTLNQEERDILEEVWSITTTLDKLMLRVPIARKKSL